MAAAGVILMVVPINAAMYLLRGRFVVVERDSNRVLVVLATETDNHDQRE